MQFTVLYKQVRVNVSRMTIIQYTASAGDGCDT